MRKKIIVKRRKKKAVALTDIPANMALIQIPKAQTVVVRKHYAWQLKQAGYEYSQIALANRCSESTARSDVAWVADDLNERGMKEAARYRRLMIARFEKFVNALWPAALNGEVEAIREIRALSERHAKLMGLDAPTKIDVTERVRRMAVEQGLDPDEAVKTADRIIKRYGNGEW